jgi:hypothetical protein
MGGADVFLAVDRDCQRPLSLQLILGEAFPIRLFKDYIEQVESQIASAVSGEPSLVALLGSDCRADELRVSKSSYCRVIVAVSDICFLWCRSRERPVRGGLQPVIVRDDSGGQIVFHSYETHVEIVDGWVSGVVRDADTVLVAERNRGASEPGLDL